jgi:hypothetical protein
MVPLLAICAAFIAAGIVMIHDPQVSLEGYFVTAFFGLGLPVFLWRIFLPAWLELSPNGLRWFTSRKVERYSWHEILEFRVYGPSAYSRQVGYVLGPQSTRHTKVSAVVRNMSGVDGGFGGSWTLGANKLMELLNCAREKWTDSTR